MSQMYYSQHGKWIANLFYSYKTPRGREQFLFQMVYMPLYIYLALLQKLKLMVVRYFHGAGALTTTSDNYYSFSKVLNLCKQRIDVDFPLAIYPKLR